MMFFHRLVSTGLGIGYIGRGAGTWAAGVCCLVWMKLPVGGAGHTRLEIGVILGIILLGIWCSGKVERIWGKDHQRVVIDEVAGMCVSLFCIPVTGYYVIAAFLLFRFFDILKPLFIKRLETLPGGWGVMSDDLLAGLYTNLVLQATVALNLF